MAINFDIANGVFRSPRVIGSPRNYSVEGNGGWSTSDQEESAVLDPNIKVYAIVVTITPRNSNSTTGSATNPVFQVFIDEQLVVSYSLNKECSDADEWRVHEVIPFNKNIDGNLSKLRAVYVADGVGGNGYRVDFSVKALAVDR